jgi:putative peptidoglycan lipid II flippase
MTRDILKHWALTAQIALNTLVGYLFIKFLASNWGASAHKDAFDVAYSIPFLLMSVSGVTFLEAVITTRFSNIHGNDRVRANAIFSGILNYLLVFSICLIGLCVMFSAQFMELLAPGLQEATKQEAQDLMLLLMPLVMVLGVGSLLSAILTAHQVPVGSEVYQLISRSGLIGGWLILGYSPTLNEAAISLSVFGACGLLFMWIIFARVTKLQYAPRITSGHSEIGQVLSQGMGLILTSVLAQAALAYLRRLGSLDGVGTIAMLSYALALIYPLSILAAKPIALVIGPRYIRYMKSGDFMSAKKILHLSCGGLLIITITIAAVIHGNAQAVIEFVLGGGEFDASVASLTGSLLGLAIWGLPAEALSRVLLVPLLNDGRMHAVSVIYSVRYILQMSLSFTLFNSIGRNGLVWSYVVAVGLQLCFEAGYLSYIMGQKVSQAS